MAYQFDEKNAEQQSEAVETTETEATEATEATEETTEKADESKSESIWTKWVKPWISIASIGTELIIIAIIVFIIWHSVMGA